MENFEYSPLRCEIIEKNQSPNSILKKINQKTNKDKLDFKIEEIKININNPINYKNYEDVDPKNKMFPKKIKTITNQNNKKIINDKKNKVEKNLKNSNIYFKKKLSDGLVSSSFSSGTNSILSNTQKNDILGKSEYIENNTVNNIENNNINNIYNIRTTNNKSTNILIKNIYSNEDYFNTNIKEGFLHLKDFEIFKSNKISQFDIEKKMKNNNDKMNKDINKSLSMLLIKTGKKDKSYNLAKSCEIINKPKNYLKTENNKLDRQLSYQLKKKRKNFQGKISTLMNHFIKKRKSSDLLIIRGTREEKGGVVDFSTASPKKYYKRKKYFINLEAKNKKLYKHPKLKIISSAKIIQKWWRNRLIIYFFHLNQIKKIQKYYKKYLYNKYKKEDDINNSFQIEEINENKKIAILLLKKVIEVKVIDLFYYVLFKVKNILNKEEDNDLISLKYISFIRNIITYIKSIKKKNIFSFFMKLKNNKCFPKNYLKSIKESNLYIKRKRNISLINNKFQVVNDNNFYYYGLNSNYRFKNINKYSQKDVMKLYNIFYRILLKLILDKIKKEANRRTLIKAFRDINNMKYPILLYALLKIHKFSIIKYNVMNAYAVLIQRKYRYFRDKKFQYCHFNY